MRKTSQLGNLYRRIGITLLILFIYIFGCSIPLPYVRITKQFTQIMRNTPLGVASFMSGSNMQQISIFMVGINPLMIAMMIMQLLMMIRLFHFDTLSASQMSYVQQILIFVLTVLQATTTTFALHLGKNGMQTFSSILILTAGSFFVVWLCLMNMQFGIGGSITIILFNIIISSIPTVSRSVKNLMQFSHPYLLIVGLIAVALVFAMFWIAFNKAYYPVKVVNVSLDSKSKLVVMPLGLNMGAMMTYMVGMALLTAPIMLSNMLHWHNFITQPTFEFGFSFVMSFLLFYFFSFVQFSPFQMARSLRNQNSYIPGIHPGKATQSHLSRLMWTMCFPGALMNAFLLSMGLNSQSFLGEYAGFALIPMNVLMMIMILNGVKDNVMTLVFPHKYSKLSQKGEN